MQTIFKIPVFHISGVTSDSIVNQLFHQRTNYFSLCPLFFCCDQFKIIQFFSILVVLWVTLLMLWEVVCCIMSTMELEIAVIRQTFETLRNRMAGRFKRTEWRKNVALECTVLQDKFFSFCGPESSDHPVAQRLYCPPYI